MLRPGEKAGLPLDVGFSDRLARERRIVVRGHGVLGTTTIEARLSYFLAKERATDGIEVYGHLAQDYLRREIDPLVFRPTPASDEESDPFGAIVVQKTVAAPPTLSKAVEK